MILSGGSSTDKQQTPIEKDKQPAAATATTSSQLYESELSLKDIIAKTESRSIEIEASILLAKLFYSQTRLQETNVLLTSGSLQPLIAAHVARLKRNEMSQQSQLQASESLRSIQLYAEVHSIRGLCLEAAAKKNTSHASSSSSSNAAPSVDDQDVIDSYEISSIFAIQHSLIMHQMLNLPTSGGLPSSSSALASSGVAANQSSASSTAASGNASALATTGVDSNSGSAISALISLNTLNNSDENPDLINPLYEIALQKAPLLYIKKKG